MTRKIFFIYCLSVLLLSACGSKQKQSSVTDQAVTAELSHAEGFSLAYAENYTAVTVYNPWKPGEIYSKYYLVKEEKTEVPADGQKVVVPLKSLMVNSATHLGFLDLLGELDKVTGVCDANYIYNPMILQGVKEGRIKDLGDAFNLDIENLLLLHPQAVMTSAYNAEDENSRKMKQTGLTLLYNIEWQEKSILGRAEWIKFIAAFFDKKALADSIYSAVEQQYDEVRRNAAMLSSAPSVMSGQDYRGTWSMPGGKSYLAQLFRDAGANYYYASDSAQGSVSSSIEEALMHFGKADIWVGVQAASLSELNQTDSKYALFKAYKNKQVYNIGKRSNKNGGNDYWESGVARPDLLLKDMIKIVHPGLMPDYELTYMQKLAE